MKENDIRPQELFNRYLETNDNEIKSLLVHKPEFEMVSCPGCGSKKCTDGLEKQGFSYALCSDCGTLYLSPRPSAELMNEFYKTSEAVKFWATEFYSATRDARRRAMFRPRAEHIQSLADELKLSRDASFADIGAGYGILLEEVSKLGRFAEIIAIEPANDLSNVCRELGFNVVQKTVEEIEETDLQVDLATSFEVLEHVPSPLNFLKGLKRVLRPSGIGLLTTLTVSGYDIQVLWENSKAIHPPHHINFISFEGVKKLVDRAGLKLISIETPGKLDVDIVKQTAAENPDIRLDRFSNYLATNATDEQRNAFQSFLQDNNLSSHIRIVVARPLKTH